MSFAKTVKEELANYPIHHYEGMSELSAFLTLCTEISISRESKKIAFMSTNPTVSKRFLKLVKGIYGSEVNLLTKEEIMFGKRKTIVIEIISNVTEIIAEHGLLELQFSKQYEMTNDAATAAAYLRGAFLSTGSINHPKTSEYHLEIYTTNANHVILLQKLLNDFNSNAKVAKRRKGYIAYIKEAAIISDFLNIVGAQKSFFAYEDIKIRRDFNNSINRVINCEIANEKKALKAANSQMADIELIENNYLIKHIDKKLIIIMELRKDNPDSSLNELVEAYFLKFQEPISKSGINHRLKRIKDLATEIREKKND